MKKLFLLGMILLLTIGCSSNKNNSTQKEKKEDFDMSL